MGYTRKQLAAFSTTPQERLKLMLTDSKSHRGDYFFSEATMEFWGSAIVGGMFKNNTFVTSEDNFDRTKKLFTARHYNWDTHSVETIGEFQQFKTRDEAIAFAKQYKEDEEHETTTDN